MDWKRSKKGRAFIYTCEGIPHAIVDRQGLGISDSITFKGEAYDTVEEAKEVAEKEYLPV